MKADSKIEGEVKDTLENLIDSYAKRDIKKLLGCFASDADVVLYGTGADEKRIGLEQIRTQAERDWAQTETAAMTLTWSSISSAGGVAWAAVDGAFKFRVEGQDMALPVRASFVLEKRKDKWLIVHLHFSTPAPGQEEGRSF